MNVACYYVIMIKVFYFIATITFGIEATSSNVTVNPCESLWKRGFGPGLYLLNVSNTNSEIYSYVNCDPNSSINQSAIIILYRASGKEAFDRTYAEYRRGFGSQATDFWYGLDNIMYLINTGHRILTITMQDWKGNVKYARYGHFMLYLPGYNLQVDAYSGTAGDDLTYQNGREFYTKDRVDPYGCALQQKVGWWYNYCAYALPTGRYYKGGKYHPQGQFYDGVYWKSWLGFDYSLKYVTMTLSTF